MKLPSDWTAERASGWWVLHHLVHKPCGWRNPLAVDVVLDDRQTRQIVYGHECRIED